MNVCIVQLSINAVSETFIRAHAQRLPANVKVLFGVPPRIDDRSFVRPWLAKRFYRKLLRQMPGYDSRSETTKEFLRLFRQVQPDVVLAEYGTCGVLALDACKVMRLPLVVYFHGYDASIQEILTMYMREYERLFCYANSIVAVAQSIRQRLISMGADPKKIHHIPCGADCDSFRGANPSAAPPVFLSCGRFVEKKAPHLTLLAFSVVAHRHPEARLRMIGAGPLLERCRDIARDLNLSDRVEFLGACPHDVVVKEMRLARAFVQHSVEAANGDCEGTPVAVMEAGASGLPVIATRHAGIPDVVVDGETGLLVDERDVVGMAVHMEKLIRDPNLAGCLGRQAQERVRTHFSQTACIERLWKLLQAAAQERPELL